MLQKPTSDRMPYSLNWNWNWNWITICCRGSQDEGFDASMLDAQSDSFDDWTQGSVPECQRSKLSYASPTQGYMKRRDLDSIAPEHAPLNYFLAFMPPLHDLIALTNQKGAVIYRPSWSIDHATFIRWYGLWVKMTECSYPNRDQYWQRMGFGDVMSRNQFEEILAGLTLPPAAPTQDADPFHGFRGWMEACNKAWQGAWECGTMLVVDESMVFWVGLGGHLTHMPHKPTPLGVCSRCACIVSQHHGTHGCSEEVCDLHPSPR